MMMTNGAQDICIFGSCKSRQKIPSYDRMCFPFWISPQDKLADIMKQCR